MKDWVNSLMASEHISSIQGNTISKLREGSLSSMVSGPKVKRSRRILEVLREAFWSISPNLITSWCLPFNKESIINLPNSSKIEDQVFSCGSKV